MRHPMAAVAMAGLASAGILAQAPATPSQQPPTFRAGTNLVRVDVQVSDSHGAPLTGLTRDDFTVTEDGVPQQIEAFRFLEVTGQPTDDLSLPIRSPDHARAEAARDDVRVFVIFWDEYHINRFESAIRARAALSDFVRTAFGPTDLVAITDQLTPSDAIRFTRDQRDLEDQIAKLQGRRGVYLPPRSELEEAQLYQLSKVELLRAQVTTSALDATVEFLGAIKDGRKSLLLVTENLGPETGDYDWMKAFIQRANATNTAVYVLDPRGLGLADTTLKTIAVDTGGDAIRSNAPLSQLRQMVRAASAFYLLGYSSSKGPLDGKYHKIAVHVNRPGAEIRARQGYYAPTVADMTRARAAAEGGNVAPDVRRALSELVTAPDLDEGNFWMGFLPGAEGPRVTASWQPDPGSRATAALRVTGAGGQLFYDGPLNGSVTFSVEPGPLTVRRESFDAAHVSTGTRTMTMDVPDYATAALVVTPPAFYRARNGLELRAIENATDTPPYAGHVFDRNDRVIIRFSVAGRLAGTANTTARLVSTNDVPLADLPLTVRRDAPAFYEVVLPVASLAPGDYLIEAAAISGQTHARALAPLRVR